MKVIDQESDELLKMVFDDAETKSLPYAKAVNDFVNQAAVEASISLLVLVQCVIFAVESLSIDIFLREALIGLDVGISVIFIMEYLLRWYGGGLRPRFLLNRYMLIDFVAIVPAVLSVTTGVNLQFIRLLRVWRIFRLQRVLQREDFIRIFGGDGRIAGTRIRIFEITVTVFSVLYVSSGLLYEAEAQVNPNIDNFFDAFYFTLVTLTTVGFGDVTPVTPMGKIIVSCSIALGVFLIPYELGRLGEALLGDMGMMAGPMFETNNCSNCGTRTHPADSNYCRVCGTRLRGPWKS